MGIPALVTGGIGPGSSIPLLLTGGLGAFGGVTPPTPTTSSTAAASTLRTRKQPKTKAERGEEWRRTMRNMQEYERRTAPKPADPVQEILAEPVPTPRVVRGPVPLDPRDAQELLARYGFDGEPAPIIAPPVQNLPAVAPAVSGVNEAVVVALLMAIA